MKHHSTKRDYWRSLEHLAQSQEIRDWADNEFKGYQPDEILSGSRSTRRRFLQLMGASMALAGLSLSGCRRWPEEKLAPYTVAPKGRMPGVPEQYATAMEVNGVAQPLLVTSFDGRPIKVEGNPTHPFSQTVAGRQGAATAIAQASVLEMYDPERSRTVVDRTALRSPEDIGQARDFVAFSNALTSMLANSGDGSKLAVLIESTSSPSTARMKDLFLNKFPKSAWYEYEPISRDNEPAGIKLATGQAGRTMLHLDKAAVVVNFDCDFLGGHPAQIRYASDWSTRRRSADSAGEMSRVYTIESAYTITGASSDVRVPSTPSHLMDMLAALAGALDVPAHGWVGSVMPEEKQVVSRIMNDVLANRGSAVIVVGSHLPPEAHQLALLVNEKIGALGSTVTLHEDPQAARPSHIQAIAELSDRIKDRNIDTLLVLGGNPAYSAPADLKFAAALQSVPNTVRLGLHFDETSEACKWHVPRAHYLEAWGDTRAWDGTASVVQPLIEPLFGGKTMDELLALACGAPETTSDQIVRKTFAGLLGDKDSDLAFRQVLDDGLLPGSEYKAITTALKPTAQAPVAPAGAGNGFEVRFLPSASMYDGRFASNGWLQELPDTTTKIVWDNAALISKVDADKLGVTTGDMVSIRVGTQEMPIAAYVLPGQPIGVIGLPLGYGRGNAGPVGTGVGFNTYELRTLASPFIAAGATVARTGESYQLATTQDQYLIDSVGFKGREEFVGDKDQNAPIIREASLTEFKADPKLFKRREDGSLALQLYDPPMKFTEPHAWGMAVDMNTCIGCNACVVACQAENNIPIVGKDQAAMGRAMHWIRIDRYFRGSNETAESPAADPNPEIVFQPVMCQHCENAPCEQVCPVAATMHDSEGLNVMVYNRCIGTRYCSNNCPYKVRRFNYLDWQSQDPRHDKFPVPYLKFPDMQQREQVDPIKRMVFNPEVTVRMRGVMEKCTYCVQRIHNTTIAKRAAGEEIQDGDILTACQQTCPTQAIVFGNLNDPNARVSQLHRGQRSYALLSELNTRPRTQYLGRIKNA